jgi:hypothetical protein
MDSLVHSLAPLILGHLPIGVTVIDPETYTIVAQNDAVAVTFGACVAKPCFTALMNRSDICPPCEMAQALSANEPRSTIITAPNGVPVLVNWIPLLQGTKRLVIETLIPFPDSKTGSPPLSVLAPQTDPDRSPPAGSSPEATRP